MRHAILRYPYPEDRCNRIITVISVVLRETTPIISDSTGETFSMESEMIRVVFLRTTEISEIARLKIRFSGSGYL